MPLSLRLANSTIFMLSINQNPLTEHGIPWLIYSWFPLVSHAKKLLHIRSVYLFPPHQVQFILIFVVTPCMLLSYSIIIPTNAHI